VAESSAFDNLCATLEEHTSLDRLSARGTVRLALKKAGLDARSVTPAQLCVLIEKLLHSELVSRGVDNPESVCNHALAHLRALAPSEAQTETPEAIFSRLGG
jgi:hypothetical protein